MKELRAIIVIVLALFIAMIISFGPIYLAVSVAYETETFPVWARLWNATFVIATYFILFTFILLGLVELFKLDKIDELEATEEAQEEEAEE